jgi:hypothetical protein
MALKTVLKPGDTLRVSKSFGTIGSAAIKKAPLVIVADNNNEPILAQEVLINKPLVRMINVLASIDGFLKQRLSNQKLLSENARLTSRETQIEQKDFVPEVQVVKPDAEKVSGGVGGLLALGGLALLTLDPVQQALKDMFEGVSSMGKFVSGIAQSINSVFTFLNGNSEPEPQAPTAESKQSTATPVAQPPAEPMVSAPVASTTPAPMANPVESTTPPPTAVPQEKPVVTSPAVTSSNKATPTPMTNVGVGAGVAMTAFSNAIRQVAPSKPAAATTSSPKPDAVKEKSAVSNVIQVNHPETGSGWGIAGAKDQHGRPVAFSKEGAEAFSRMMQDSGGVVKPSDVASSKRSPEKNASLPNAATNSLHLSGIAMDIHGQSNAWIKANGHKYGWVENAYSGSHGGHFEFKGPGMAPGPGSSLGETVAKTVTSGIESIGKILGMLGSAIIKPGIPKDDLPKIISQASRELNTEIAVSKTKKPVQLPRAKTPPRINKSNSGATQNPASSDDKNSVYYYLHRFGYSDLSTPEASLKTG